MYMPFGKYGPSKLHPSGVDLCFVTSGYLKWLLRQDWFLKGRDNPLRLAVEKELKLRDADGSHFYEDKIRLA